MKTFVWCLMWMAFQTVNGQGLHFEPISVNLGKMNQHETRDMSVKIEKSNREVDSDTFHSEQLRVHHGHSR